MSEMTCEPSNAGEEVVLTGLSGRLPECDSIEEFARKLFAGEDLVTVDDRRWTPGIHGLPNRHGKLNNLSHFDASFFGVHPKQADLMDPQLRLLLEVVHETIVDAGLSPTELRGSRTGVYMGVMQSESFSAWSADVDKINGYALLGCCSSMFPNRVSYAFDLKGPSIAIDTACSSSLYALSQAVEDIRTGRCDAALVAGSNLCLDPAKSLNFHRLTMLSPDGRCAAFDKSGGGFVRSEAVVAVLLQRRVDARRVYCTVRGAGVSNDGYKEQGITHPSGAMQLRLARETFEEARLRPQDVVYIEAHGTGTKVGDPEEVNAMAELFCKDRESPLLMGAVKSNIGHTEIASGLCAVAKIVLAMERGLIPGNLHFKEPNPDIPALSDGRIKVVDRNTPWEGGLVALNSLGFGGANAHVILEGGRGSRPTLACPLSRLVLASGRTEEAVQRLLTLAAEHPQDSELHALIDAVHARGIPGHLWRGYAVLDPRSPVLEALESAAEPRPVWFMFSGMGSQWAGMGRELLRLPAFATSIARSAAALEPYGLDLMYVIAEAPDTALDDAINCFVAITAVQVALVDVLRALGVRPDVIIGHSFGEIGCAYADETLTAEQTVLCAYWRGRCVLDARLEAGAMAAVGLSREDAARRCPADIDIACHNAPDNVTISGPLTSVERVVEELSADGVFVRMVKTSGVAFHSQYVARVAPLLSARLKELIPEPKPRSARWLSSSVPQDQWDCDLARLSDAAYHVNNMMSPVLFAGLMEQVPTGALVVEVAPHALLQAVLRRALPGALYVPLVRRHSPDALVHLLAAVGKIYAAGAQPQVSGLYPSVSWPVSRGTPSLASHVAWDHSTEWSVANFMTAKRTSETIIEYDVRNPDHAFITGHNVDGKVLFPGTGYLMLVWRTVAKINNLDIEQVAVVFENVNFVRATIMPSDAPLRFLVSLLGSSGEFEVCEGGELVTSGTVRMIADPAIERHSANAPHEDDDLPPLDSEDIYKELRLRGYNYQGIFRGIKYSNARGTRGLLKWEGNWISYMDTVLQYSLISIDNRHLYLPTRIQRVVIDPKALRESLAASDAIPVQIHRNLNVIVASGIEIRDVTLSLVQRRIKTHAALKLEKCEYLPLDGTCTREAEQSRRHALTAALQLVLENCNVLQLKLIEAALQRPVDALLLPLAVQVLEAEPVVRVVATLVAGGVAARYTAAMDPLHITVSNKDVLDPRLELESHLVLGGDVLARHGAGLLDRLAELSGDAGFVLLEEPAQTLDKPAQQSLLAAANLTLISRVHAASHEYVLLRRAAVVPSKRVVVEARNDEYTWIESLKDAMKQAEREDMRVYVWSRTLDSGVQGLAKCLRREPGGHHLRVYYLPGAQHAFDSDAPAYKAQVQRDLAFNVLRAGVWGTFRHLPLDAIEAELQVEHAYVNTLTNGDLSSLRWIESDMRYAAVRTQRPHTTLCHVHYSSLNFHDIMLATGKLPPDALPEDMAFQDCILGLEFSGFTSSGKRVMGMVQSKGLATTVVGEDIFTWEIPKQWSLEEAATVPVAYATAYYALAVRGRVRRSEAVLVHCGAGGVGQAAIAIALHAGCTVFTTVGTADKRAFLRQRFPEIPDANIGNSRDCSFESLVMDRTDGRGVDLVLNSLAHDKLQASVRCLGDGGRFLEIGKSDLHSNTALGMSVLLKNATVHGILLDKVINLSDDHPEKMETVRCVSEGIASGVVRPLPATVFMNNQLEQAFRYMATGKHIGKVMIRVRETGEELVSTKLMPAIPRIYMHPSKSYVLVGGLGGFGLELGEWLVERGARILVCNSRSGVRTGYQARCIRRWRNAGVRVLVSALDATSAAGARALLADAAAAAPVGGVFNLAVVLRDAFLENQTPGAFHVVARPKIDVTRALDIASRELAPKLEHFVMFSSAASRHGNIGASNYGFANSAIERLCEQRRAAGLPALAVQWGAIGDVGLWATTYSKDAVAGMVPQGIASCLATLGTLMSLPHAVVSSMVLADKRRSEDAPTQDMAQAVANVLGIRDVKHVSQNATLVELGMDSLMTAEIKQLLESGYDVALGVEKVRALTFAMLRSMAGDSTAHPPASTAHPVEFPCIGQLLPKEVIVRLPSKPPANSDDRPIFMVHPIQGTVELLRELAASVRGTVLGLQCVAAAALDNMAALASFYLQRVRTAQPLPPYTLLGYSFGACVAFEMALQLERDGCAVQLVLVEGAPGSMASLAAKINGSATNEADALAYFGKLFYNLDSAKVREELRQLPNWEQRVNHMTESVLASGAVAEKDVLHEAVKRFRRILMITESYSPTARLQGPVTLFKARGYKEMEQDYGLKALCAGELDVCELDSTHDTIVTGAAAQNIANHVSDLLTQHGWSRTRERSLRVSAKGFKLTEKIKWTGRLA